jgi:threonine aldolase
LHVEPPQTNLVYVEIPASKIADLKRHLESQGILATITPRTRLATHLDVPRDKIEAVLRAFRDYPRWD